MLLPHIVFLESAVNHSAFALRESIFRCYKVDMRQHHLKNAVAICSTLTAVAAGAGSGRVAIGMGLATLAGMVLVSRRPASIPAEPSPSRPRGLHLQVYEGGDARPREVLILRHKIPELEI